MIYDDMPFISINQQCRAPLPSSSTINFHLLLCFTSVTFSHRLFHNSFDFTVLHRLVYECIISREGHSFSQYVNPALKYTNNV